MTTGSDMSICHEMPTLVERLIHPPSIFQPPSMFCVFRNAKKRDQKNPSKNCIFTPFGGPLFFLHCVSKGDSTSLSERPCGTPLRHFHSFEPSLFFFRGQIVRLSSSLRAMNSKILTETLCLSPWLNPKARPREGILQSWLWRALPRLL